MNERHIISFPIGSQRFNFRVAGIIVVDNHVLICSEDDDDYAMLPGGRIELGEDSKFSLSREIAEELDMPGRVGALVATSESFYRRVGEDFHELGFFYEVALPGQGPDGNAPWLQRWDEGHLLKFSWVSLEGAALEKRNLLPSWLPNYLRTRSRTLTHIIHDERV
ncbi:NUDIX domain-containing protein [Devosia sp. MC521]|uniref:NUDIX hydrolase n=1 Tax=Devosia sp. MC521 TaxID=2759954 RepID=UPI0015FB9878|nr:NUDIX domain-containing protein [Devosia sp. MC521]MBJ6987956.1 NUDIX domain-containing protein [Devosia sp. MC521]QMW62033.1 NUDIX domain-containing protein [Devosia sp. MC521]